jgi:hypothetical protein
MIGLVTTARTWQAMPPSAANGLVTISRFSGRAKSDVKDRLNVLHEELAL